MKHNQVIQRVGGTWDLFIHEGELVPEGAQAWFQPSQKLESTQSIGRLVGYLKRYGKTNSGSATWHIVPFTSVKDGSKWFSLYVS